MSQKPKSQKLNRSQSGEDDDITEIVVNDAVKAILRLDQSKKPIKQSEIVNSLHSKLRRKFQNDLWRKVQEKLNDMGLKIKDCSTSQGKAFVLVLTSKDYANGYKYAAKEERADRTLLTLILAYIHMKDGLATEEEIYRHLRGLRILNEGDKQAEHKYFGDVCKKVSSQFVEQQYLVRTPVPDSDIVELRWGRRANYEVSPADIMKFVCKVGYKGEVEPHEWGSNLNPSEEEDSE